MKKIVLAALLAFVAGASALAASQERVWKADPVHSSATFTATHLGISHVTGVIPIRSATLNIPDGTNIPASASAVFDPSGVDTRNSDRDADLRSPHFFEVTTYPDMHFTSTKIVATDATHFSMTGDLTMHGQTHPVTLSAHYLGRMSDSRGRDHIAYEATTTIDRSQWGMTWGNPFAGTSIDIAIDIEAVSAPAHS